MSFTTFDDVIAHGVDYLGGNVADQVQRDVRRAALEAYRDLANAHNWSYLYRHGRVITTAQYGSQVDGSTITYQQSSGSYPLQVTLAGGMWPSWTASGYLQVGLLKYRVAQVISATVLTLDPEVNPGSDITTPTTYVLYQDTYLLPEDFIAQDQGLYELNFGGMDYVHPREWLYVNRYVFAEGIPKVYTITGDPEYPSRLVVRVAPLPVAAQSIDFVYKRRPRPLVVSGLNSGKASVSGSAVTATASIFTPAMVGSVVRLGGSVVATKPPTDIIGSNPPLFESVIASYVSPTQVVASDSASAVQTTVPFSVSDPVDFEYGAMLNAYFRCVEKHLGMNRTLKDKPSAAAQYLTALNEARAADSRSFMGRHAGQKSQLHQRMRDMPVGPDQP